MSRPRSPIWKAALVERRARLSGLVAAEAAAANALAEKQTTEQALADIEAQKAELDKKAKALKAHLDKK
jgi:hypothetical protein